MVLVIRDSFVICWNFFPTGDSSAWNVLKRLSFDFVTQFAHFHNFFLRWSVFPNSLRYYFFFCGRNFNVALFLTEKTRWARFPFLSVNKIAASLLRRESFPADFPKSFIKIFTSHPRLLSKVDRSRKLSTCERLSRFFHIQLKRFTSWSIQ